MSIDTLSLPCFKQAILSLFAVFCSALAQDAFSEPSTTESQRRIVTLGGTVTEMSSYRGRYEKARFESRQALIDRLQIEPREYQFATPSAALHARSFRLYAAEQDDRILVVETVACDMFEYRGIHFSSTGVARTTAVKWTELFLAILKFPDTTVVFCDL